MGEPAPIDFIPCLNFIKRGVAKARPVLVKATKEELKEIVKEMKLKEAEFNSRPRADGEDVEMADDEENDSDAKIDDYYGMENYDDEPASGNIAVETFMLNESDDEEDDGDSSEDEPNEYAIQPEDNLILVGHVVDDVCMLETYVFNNDRAELFVLHDTFLPSYPLSIEWLDFDVKQPDKPGHFAAVSSMDPRIDIWDLNTTGCLEPYCILGGKKAKGIKHTDAVIDLSWNTINRNVLASGSADQTVVLWNLQEKKSIHKLSVFEDKVQSVKWHPVEASNLLTGCCDGKVRLCDCRSSSAFKTWVFEGELEKILWNHLDPAYFFATTDKGMVHCVDVRTHKALWNLQAHTKEVTGIALSSQCQHLLVTGSMDEAVKVWDLKDNKPALVATKVMDVGPIYCVTACPEVSYVFCTGGSKKDNSMYLWDVRENKAVVKHFGERMPELRTYSQTGKSN